MKRLPVFALAGMFLPFTPTAEAQVFEVIHPDVEKGQFELEALNGLGLGSIANGDERYVLELALGYSPFDFWKTKFAVELAKPENQTTEIEAYEWENVFILPIGNTDHDHSHHDGDGGFEMGSVGVYAALEVPNEGGISEGGAAVGPIAEATIGPVITVANLFLDIPFADGEDPGISYAISGQVPVTDWVDLGAEAHGSMENAFGSGISHGHFIGPAAYFSAYLGRARILEPRVALLFGLNDDTPDAVLSVNFELKF
jgi:hypothetical protein